MTNWSEALSSRSARALASQLTEGPAPIAVANALQRYFAGELEALDSIEVATAGTELQERAWAALRRIPAGQTTTYGALGKSVGINGFVATKPSTAPSRVVGAASVLLVRPHQFVEAR